MPTEQRPTGSRRRLGLFGVVAAIVLIVVVITGIRSREEASAKLRQWTDDQAVPTVTVALPDAKVSNPTLDLPGRLEAYYRAPIFARVSGYLKNWSADIGARVKASGPNDVVTTNADWHEAQLKEQRLPYRKDLDTVAPSTPVVVVRGGHEYILNSAALRKYGIERLSALARERSITLAVLPGEDRDDARLSTASTLPHQELDALLGIAGSGSVGDIILCRLEDAAVRLQGICG